MNQKELWDSIVGKTIKAVHTDDSWTPVYDILVEFTDGTEVGFGCTYSDRGVEIREL